MLSPLLSGEVITTSSPWTAFWSFSKSTIGDMTHYGSKHLYREASNKFPFEFSSRKKDGIKFIGFLLLLKKYNNKKELPNLFLFLPKMLNTVRFKV